MMMNKMKINIIGISKARWQGVRKITMRKFEIFYSAYIENMEEEWLLHLTKTVKGYWTQSGRVLLLKIAGKI